LLSTPHERPDFTLIRDVATSARALHYLPPAAESVAEEETGS
jgi:hypothetical protein